jgi:hypothetical protein
VHDLSDANPTRIHLTVPRDFRATDDAVVTHPGFLDDHDVESHGPWRVTTVERTLADAAGGDLSQELVDAAVSEALSRGETTRRRLLRQSDGFSDHAALRLERALAAQAATT